MTTYKLSYFNFTALGEPIRFLLSYGKANFEDHRVEQEVWPSLKPSMPFGQMPVLEVNGKKVHQSLAICRYLGRQFGIAGSDDWEALQVDIMAETITDFRQKVAIVHYETDEEIKQNKHALLVSETIPYYLAKFDAIAKENNGYFANGKLSWVDLYFVAYLNVLNTRAKFDILEKYPNLQKLKENVLNLPQITEWIAKRPKTIF